MTRRPDLAYALLFLLVIVACLAIVGTVEGRSLDPNTGCRWDEVLTADGTCR